MKATLRPGGAAQRSSGVEASQPIPRGTVSLETSRRAGGGPSQGVWRYVRRQSSDYEEQLDVSVDSVDYGDRGSCSLAAGYRQKLGCSWGRGPLHAVANLEAMVSIGFRRARRHGGVPIIN
jgi:hypothetical protein